LIVLDTTVLSYAVGADHPLRESSRRIVDRAASSSARFTTTTEVIQEFAHVHARRRPRRKAARLARSYVELLSPLVEITAEDLQVGLKLFERHDLLGAFDAVLAAVALNRGADALVSGDDAFGSVQKLPFVALGSPELDSLLG
jgi:predicted nucleic acid-binding protein